MLDTTNYEIENENTEGTELTTEKENSKGGFGVGLAIAAVVTTLVVIGKVAYDKFGPKKEKPSEEIEEPVADVEFEEKNVEAEEETE